MESEAGLQKLNMVKNGNKQLFLCLHSNRRIEESLKSLKSLINSMSFTYDPSDDAWVLDLKPNATLNTVNNMSSSPANQSVAFASDDPKTPASFNDRSRVGVTRCWDSIKERFTVCFGNRLRNEGKKSMLPSQCGCYRQASVGDRDEKLSEAIVYCKKTMRQEEAAAGV